MSLSSSGPTIATIVTRFWWLVLVIALLVPANAGAGSAPEQQRLIEPSTLLIQLPARYGEAKRPPAEFNHGKHSTALEQEGCKACHPFTPEGKLVTKLQRNEDPETRKQLIRHYHDACIGCHQEREAKLERSLPDSCGDCHKRVAAEPVLLRSAMAFDYSLHARHAGPDEEQCKSCHHQWDPASQQLVWVTKKESACRDCHGAEDVIDGEGRMLLSLRNASHTDCLSCHLRLGEQGKEHGPTTCVGCHGAEQQQSWKRLAPEEIPRIKRDQPDLVWIHSDGARSKLVSFNHQAHEGQTTFCTTCHHQTLKACKDCHSLTGSDEGKQVTAAVSYHTDSSDHSCVGCHKTTTASATCGGCHSRLPQPPTASACIVCHNGPQPPADLQPEQQETILAAAHPSDVTLAALPAFSPDSLPETVVIDQLADEYEPSTLPHGKIVARLDAIVRSSKLASRFHGQTEVLCSGCHHHSPVGTRPPQCRACHGETADATTDKPALKAAYHRQCIGCHQEMQIKALECTSCHAKKGVQP